LTLLAIPISTLVFAEELKPLFNGKDLDGWVLVNTPPQTWKVEDGLLVCSGKPVGELRTERMYQNFILEVEWRHLVARGNAGIFVWADDITARGVPFHRSIEVQVLENAYGNSDSHTTHGDIFPIHGATMKPINGRGGSRAFPSEERSKPSPEWNHYRIVCRDGEVSLAVNGKVVTRGKECSPRKGYICLESEGGVVHYRNLKLQELPASPIEDEHVAIANRGYRSIYTGLNFDGLKIGGKGRWNANDWVLGYGAATDANGDTTKDDRLVTEEQFGDYGFLFDVRPGKGAKSLLVAPRGGAGMTLGFGGEKAQLSPGWNRVSGEIRGEFLSLSINGKDRSRVKLDQEQKSGPLKLMPKGSMDFANLYVRELGP